MFQNIFYGSVKKFSRHKNLPQIIITINYKTIYNKFILQDLLYVCNLNIANH